MVKPARLYHKAKKRIMILGNVKRGLITLKHASELLHISYRHAKRLYKEFKNTGIMGLLPKKRTKPPKNKTPEAIKLKIINLKIQFPEINCCHIKDLLKEENTPISHETIRTILIKNHLHTPKHKRRPRKRFEAEQAGKLVQMDTSPYQWIPGIEKELSLIITLDDHSRKPLVLKIAEHDTTWENMTVLRRVIEKYGIFETLYTDCDSKFRYIRNNPSVYFNYQKDPQEIKTQIHQALSELGITLLNTHPYAPYQKGKVERFAGFLQARLPIEFRVHNITTIQAANDYLERYLDKISSSLGSSYYWDDTE